MKQFYMCNVAAMVHPLKVENVKVYLENMERQGILVSYQWKIWMGVAT